MFQSQKKKKKKNSTPTRSDESLCSELVQSELQYNSHVHTLIVPCYCFT